MRAFAAVCFLWIVTACNRTPEPSASPERAPARSAPPAPTSSPVSAAPAAAPSGAASASAGPAESPALAASYRYPAAERLVAIGDLHGDLSATRRALALAGAIDAQDRWIGGKLVVVQTGDEIDRGDGDRAIVELFDRLADAAKSAGGAVHALDGNHEAMNVSLDFRYVTRGGFAAFADVPTSRVPGAVLQQFPVEARGRVAAFYPGGPMASRLAQRDAVAIVGDTVFVHGGVTAEHVAYGIGRFNREVKRWMSGEGAPPSLVASEQGPLWTRRYSEDEAGVDCEGLGAALAALGVKRMVVGHTVHRNGISPACGDRVYRIDTGLSSFYGGPIEVLEIRGDTVKVLRDAR